MTTQVPRLRGDMIMPERTIEVTINEQQRQVVERVRRETRSDLTLAEFVRQGFREWLTAQTAQRRD